MSAERRKRIQQAYKLWVSLPDGGGLSSARNIEMSLPSITDINAASVLDAWDEHIVATLKADIRSFERQMRRVDEPRLKAMYERLLGIVDKL